MKISLNTPARKRLVLGLGLVLAIVYAGQATRLFAAAWLGSRVTPRSLRMAAWLDPGDADYRNHLGRYYDLVARDPGAAAGYYQAAVELNPHSARYWFDLASAYQVLGDTTNQTAALEHAIQADAMTPDVAWEAANLYLVRGENEKALREFGVVLANDASLATAAIQFCWHIDPNVDELLANVVPHTAEANLALLNLLETKNETAGTAKAWDGLMATRQPFDVRQVFDYVKFLVLHKDVDQAVRVWQQSAPRFGLTSYLPSSNNLIVNGNFDLEVLNNGFDWQYQKQFGVGLTLDPREFHSGRRSFMISFDGPGISDAGVYQFVAVQPGTAYNFSAFYKTNGDQEGAGAPHITIQDMYTQAVYYDSDELKEAGYWKSVEGEFTTSPDCKLVVVHVRRLPAGSPIRGKLWIDDFHLTRKSS